MRKDASGTRKTLLDAMGRTKSVRSTNLFEFSIAENACFRLVNSSEHNVSMRKTAGNGRIHVLFHMLTNGKTQENAFQQIY